MTSQKFGFVYLRIMPVAATILAFAVGHVSPVWYIPFWLLNTTIMIVATRSLTTGRKKSFPIQTAWLFVVPWMLMAIFGGMGPPPETADAWASLATEQVVRYTILIISEIIMAIGFVRTKHFLSRTLGKDYARISAVIFCIATPLFVLNMAYWGYFLTHAFIIYTTPGTLKRPDWHQQLADVFTVVRMTEVSLIYLATAALAIAMKLAGKISNAGASVYLSVAIAGALLNLLPGSVKGPVAIASYLSYIPAFTLLMPYLIIVNAVYKRLSY
jgi:hypothetical protein